MSKSSMRWLELTLVLVLFGLALAVRVYHLRDLPPGLYADEAANGLDALDVLAGKHAVFFERNYGREALFIYLEALLISLVGATPFALRLTAALVGALTIPATYWMIRELFAPMRFATRVPVQWLALWTTLLLTFSYWHISLSRVGFRAIALPLIATVGFALFWHAWHRLHDQPHLPWITLVLSGLVLGLSLYTYIAARMVPLLVAVVVIASLWRAPTSQQRRRVLAATGVLFLASVVILLPLLAYFLAHPASFMGRATSVSIFSATFGGENPLRALGISLWETIKLFFVTPDPNLRHNPAERPVIELTLALWLVGGLVVLLRRVKQESSLFVLAWLALFALPAILTAEGIPHSLRAVGMLPMIFVPPVIAILLVASWLTRFHRGALVVLPLIFVGISSFVDVRDYFAAWDDPTRQRHAFLADYVDFAAAMSGYGETDAVWILPLSPNYNLPENTFYTIDFMYRGQPAYGPVLVEEETISQQMAEVTRNRRYAYLIHGEQTETLPDAQFIFGDPKNLTAFVLTKHARIVGTEPEETIGLPFTIYALPVASDYAVAKTYAPVGANFDGQVTLLEMDHGGVYPRTRDDDSGQVWSGDAAWFVLRWRAEQPIDVDLKASVTIQDAATNVVGQVDDLLVSDRYPVERTWDADETTSTYHIVPILPGTLPGDYQIHVRVYAADSGRIYPVIDADGEPLDAALFVGTVHILPPEEPASMSPSTPLPDANPFDDALRLLGYDLLATTVRPGDMLPLSLYWQAVQPPATDYTIDLQLRDPAGGAQPVVRRIRPIGRAYGTSQWRAGDAYRDWHDLAIAPETPTGTYGLVVNVLRDEEIVGEVALAEIEVAGRARLFAPPSLDETLDAQFGRAVRLLGINGELVQSAAPGDTVDVELIWQAVQPPQAQLVRFLHIVDANGQLVAQQDTLPCDGECPASSWLAREVLVDHASVSLPSDLPPGHYTAYVGWYDQETLTRLQLVDAPDEGTADDLLPLPISIEVE